MTESETRFYTEAQANDLLGKKVITRVTLYQKCPAGTSGIIDEIYPRGDGDYGVMMKWNQPEQRRDGFSREEVEDYLIVDHLTTTQQRLAFYARYESYLQKIAYVIQEESSLEEIKSLVDSAMITDDCPVCTNPWGYCICKA
jgi:hypothetical protein